MNNLIFGTKLFEIISTVSVLRSSSRGTTRWVSVVTLIDVDQSITDAQIRQFIRCDHWSQFTADQRQCSALQLNLIILLLRFYFDFAQKILCIFDTSISSYPRNEFQARSRNACYFLGGRVVDWWERPNYSIFIWRHDFMAWHKVLFRFVIKIGFQKT